MSGRGTPTSPWPTMHAGHMADCSIISCSSNISIGGNIMSEESTEETIETNHEDISKTCLNPLLSRRNHTLMGATDSLDQVISILCYLSLLIKKSLGEEEENAVASLKFSILFI